MLVLQGKEQTTFYIAATNNSDMDEFIVWLAERRPNHTYDILCDYESGYIDGKVYDYIITFTDQIDAIEFKLKFS